MACRKLSFATWSEANEAVERVISQRNFHPRKRAVLVPYFCSECFCFHIGHEHKQADLEPRRKESKLRNLLLKYLT